MRAVSSGALERKHGGEGFVVMGHPDGRVNGRKAAHRTSVLTRG